MSNFISKYALKYEKASVFALTLLLFFPVLPIRMNSYIIGFVMLLSLAGLFFQSSRKPAFHFEKPWIISISFFILAISLLYTQNISEGFFELEKRSALIIYPLIFLLRKKQISQKMLQISEYVFIGCILILFTWVNIKIVFSIKEIINEGILVKNWSDILTNESFSFFYRNSFQKFSMIHPTYACILSLFSSGVLIINLLNGDYSDKIKRKIFIFLLIAILILYSFFLAAKGPLLAFVISLVVVLFIKLKKSQFYIVSSSLILIFAIAILILPPLKERVKEVFYPNQTEVISSVSIRKIIHQSSWELIRENGLFGLGVGDVQTNLNKKYETFNEDKVTSGSMNTHNEYFNLWLSAGLAGLLSLLITLVLPLVDSIKRNDLNFVFFLVFISICFLFENILSRQKGVLFFAVFYLIYYFYQVDNKKCPQDIQNI